MDDALGLTDWGVRNGWPARVPVRTVATGWSAYWVRRCSDAWLVVVEPGSALSEFVACVEGIPAEKLAVEVYREMLPPSCPPPDAESASKPFSGSS